MVNQTLLSPKDPVWSVLLRQLGIGAVRVGEYRYQRKIDEIPLKYLAESVTHPASGCCQNSPGYSTGEKVKGAEMGMGMGTGSDQYEEPQRTASRLHVSASK